MKKQSGFTLIELMVVMAIIAILATAGLSAYTGYIKKARDTTRIADLAAINTIALGQISVSGTAPTITELRAAILAANNNSAIQDPLQTGGAGIAGAGSCLANGAATSGTSACNYIYQRCDSDSNFRLLARFESGANGGMYNTVIGTATATASASATFYSVSQCSAGATASPATETATTSIL